MIQITLQFTTIAAALKALHAVDESALAGLPTIVDVKTDAPAPTAAPGKSAKSAATPAPSPRTAEAVVAAAPAPSTEPPAPQPATETAAAATSAAKVEYKDLQQAVLKLHKMDPTAAVPIAQSLGAPTFKALAEDKWAEALRLVNEAIAAKG